MYKIKYLQMFFFFFKMMLKFRSVAMTIPLYIFFHSPGRAPNIQVQTNTGYDKIDQLKRNFCVIEQFFFSPHKILYPRNKNQAQNHEFDTRNTKFLLVTKIYDREVKGNNIFARSAYFSPDFHYKPKAYEASASCVQESHSFTNMPCSFRDWY